MGTIGMSPARSRVCLWMALLLAGVLLPGALTAEDGETEAEPAVEEQPAAEQDAEAETVKDEKKDAYDQIELLAEVMLHIRKHYVEEKSYQDIVYGALHGMLQGLDTHSGFLEPAAYSDMQDDTQGHFSGIGIHIGMRDGLLTVIAPIEDTPAFRAGLMSGDRIIEVDGDRTQGWTLREAVSRLRGPRGVVVAITIRREGEEDPIEVDIVRDDIEVPSVKGARMLTDRVGYVRVTQFSATTPDALQRALDELLAQNMDALILDLRNDPGGLLRSAVEVAEKFLEADKLIVTTRGREGVRDDFEARAGGRWRNVDFLMAVLVNPGSASASEIVAGALQDHKRAILVGDTTFGKASVQSVIRLRHDGEAAIRLTTAHYYTPNGREIHERGLDPDIRVYVPPSEWRRVLVRRAHLESPELFNEQDIAEYADADDAQLRRAVEVLEGILVFQSARE